MSFNKIYGIVLSTASAHYPRDFVCNVVVEIRLRALKMFFYNV